MGNRPFDFDYSTHPPVNQDIDTMRRIIQEYEEVYGFTIYYYPLLDKGRKFDPIYLEQRTKNWDEKYTMKAVFDFLQESIEINMWGSEHIETLDIYIERNYFKTQTTKARTEDFSGLTGQTLELTFYPVEAGSLSLIKNGVTLIEGNDYTIDLQRGTITLTEPAIETDTFNVNYTSYYEPTVGDLFQIAYNGLTFEITNVAQENPSTIFFGVKLLYAITARIFEPSNEDTQLEEELEVNDSYGTNDAIEEESNQIYDYPPDEKPFGDY